jgi:hypothetical protein
MTTKQEAAQQCLAYLAQIAKDFCRTLPPSARGPTRAECQVAFTGLQNFIKQAPPPSVDAVDADSGM